MHSFVASVEAFEQAYEGSLSAADAPALVTLHAIASSLDENGLQAALVSQFGLTFRALEASLSRRSSGETVDPLAAALDEASGG